MKIITNYKKLSDSNLMMRVLIVISRVTGNVNFQSLQSKIAQLAILNNQFSTAVYKAAFRDRVLCAQKRIIKEDLNNLLTEIGKEVQVLSNSEKLLLLSSGFTLQTKKVTKLILPKVFLVKNEGDSGTVKFIMKGKTNAINYLFEYTYVNPYKFGENVQWNRVNAKTKTFIFRQMIPDKQIFCRVKLIGEKGQNLYTNILSLFVN